jgi:hypothetical protein
VSHEEKVVALSVLEAGASGLRDQAPCGASTLATYRDAARAAVEDPDWAVRLDVAAVDCSTDPDLHEVRLRVDKPRGGIEQLQVTVGGPQVGGVVDEAAEIDPPTIVSCAVTGIEASPDVVALSDSGVLSQTITLTAETDAVCAGGYLLARFSPPPLGDDPENPGNLVEVEVPFQVAPEVERQYNLTLPAGLWTWSVGSNDVTIVYSQLDGTTIPAGGAPDLFELTCGVTAEVDAEAPVQVASGQLQNDVEISVALSPACPTPDSMTYEVDTGVLVATGDLVEADGVWTGTVLGELADGPQFVAGPTIIDVLDGGGQSIASIPIEVMAP